MSTPPLTSSYSSSFCYAFTYDVFISFRGCDTRYGFTNNLYQALLRKGIHTFFGDDELRNGEEITQSLEKAIEESRIAIVVFSKNYASSSFCLDELVKIMECVTGNGRLVFPVFYDVDPSDVRHQKGSYADAFTKHEERFKDDKEKVQKWRSALRQGANLSGSDFKLQREYEHAFIENIVKEISNRIGRAPLHVADYPVGLESRAQEVNMLLTGGSNNGALMVGIYGVGGIGKTTLAKEVYNLIADPFHGLCFLENVRENSIKHGLAYLQESFLCKILGVKDIKLASVSEGISLIKKRLNSKKVLLVLDDIDKPEQLRAIAGRPDWFGPGSIIIITTRDKHLLASHLVERTYQVKEFDEKEALELLSWNAFKHENVDPSYMDILNKVVSYASGLPLALEVIGSNLYGRSVEEWISALDEYKKIPNKDIQKILKVSFDALEEYHQTLFLDIACCFKGYDFEDLKDTLHALHDVNPIFGIRVLAERSLVKIYNENDRVTQHDLIQEMGREIVRQESLENPGKRSRLWLAEDVLQVLQENIGTNKIELMFLEAPMSKVINWDGEAFRKMENLKTLIIKSGNFFKGPNHLPNSLRVLEWCGYPSHSLPPDFHPKKLSILKLPNNCFTQLPLVKLLKEFVEVTVLDFSRNDWITHIPDVSSAPNLKKLCLRSCENLVEIDESVGLLNKLRILDVDCCRKLRSLPSLMLPSLRILNFAGCYNLQRFPEILGKMENIERLMLFDTGIRELPYSICNLTGLQELRMFGCCGNTIMLPSSLFLFEKLGKLELVGQVLLSNEEEGTGQGSSASSSSTMNLDLYLCNISDKLLEIFLARFPNVEQLKLSRSNITVLPACMKNCRRLKFLDISECKNLKEIRGIPPNIRTLNANDSTSLSCSSRELLLNKELHESVGEKRFILPGVTIPSWFEHQSSGEQPISFWFRNKFPGISVCLVFMEEIDYVIEFHVNVIRYHARFCRRIDGPLTHSLPTTGHTWIYDLEDYVEHQFAQNKWHQAKVYLSKSGSYGKLEEMTSINKEISIKIGVQINEKSSMGDIQFTDPLLDEALHMRDSHKPFIITLQYVEDPYDILPPEDKGDKIIGCRNSKPSKFRRYQLGQPLSPLCTCAVAIENDPGSNAIVTSTARPDLVSLGPSESSNTSCSGKAREGEEGEEVHPISTGSVSSTSSIDKYLSNECETIIGDDDDDDVEMDAFYTSFDVAGIPMLSSSHEKLFTTIPSDEEIRQALRSVQRFLSHDASILLNPEMCSILKAKLDYLSKLSADHGSISRERSKVILEASQFLARWSRDYTKAHTKIDYIMSQLLRIDELEMSLGSNMKSFSEVVEQLNTIKAIMTVSQSEEGIYRKRKREIFEEGKTIKAELDELKKNVPQWEHEHTLAKKTQANVIAEWSRLRETFQNIEKDWNLSELD